MYEETTGSIRVKVEPRFLEDESAPDEHHFFWAYHVVIENKGKEPVQLVSRYWRITDSRGRVREVRGEGVVGKQPVIAPGERFEYTSGAPLETPSGFMQGRYQMRSATGDSFEVGIPLFALDSPHETQRMH